MAWNIKGRAGTLKCGGRVAATFKDWEARITEEGRWRVTSTVVDTDPYWLEHGTTFRVALEMGTRGGVNLPVEVVSRDPLEFLMEIPA